MGKRLARVLKVLVGLLFLAGLSLYLLRQPMLDALLDSQLTRLGVPVHSLKVEDVTLSGLVLRDITLGNSDELRTDKINTTWHLPGLLKGDLQTIEVSGLRLLLNLSGEGPPLGSLQKLITGESGSSRQKTPLVTLQDAKLELKTRYGNMVVNLDGIIKQGPADEILIKLKLSTDNTAGRAEGKFDATLDKNGNLQGTFTISEGTLTLPSLNIAGLNVTSSFSLVDNQLNDLSAELELSDISLPASGQTQSAFEQATLIVQMDPSSARINGNLFTAGKTPVFSINATSRDHQQHANIDVDLTADVTAELPVWDIFGLPQPTTGSARLNLVSSGQIPAACIKNSNWQECLHQSMLTGNGTLTLDELAYSQKVSSLNSEITFDANLKEGNSSIVFMKDSLLAASGLDTNWIKSLGLPVEQTSFLKEESQLSLRTASNNNVEINLGNRAEGIKLDFNTDLELSADTAKARINTRANVTMNQQNQIARFKVSELETVTSGFDYAGNTLDQLTLTGSIQGSPGSFTGELDLSTNSNRLRYESLVAQQAKVTLPLQLNFKDRIWKFTLREQGQLSFKKLEATEIARIPGPLSIRIPSATVEFIPTTNGLAFKHQISIAPDDFKLLVNRNNTPAVEAEIQPGRIIITGEMDKDNSYTGKSVIRATDISLPQYQVQIDNIASTIYLAEAGKGMHADFIISEIRQTSPTASFAPVNVTGNLKLQRKQLSVKALAGIPDLKLFTLTAKHSLTGNQGNLNLALNPLVFSPGTLQPLKVFPGLEMLEDVSGEINSSSNFRWSKKGINSEAVFVIKNLSFVQNNTTLNGLSATLKMTDLLSPQSEPKQKITIQEINPGVPIRDVEITYQVQATETPKVHIDQSRLTMLDGSLSTGPVIIDPLATHNAVVIQVDGINLTELFNLIEVDGLAGEGRLNGSIPISFDDGRVSIQDSVLIADNPGILRINSGMVSNILSGKAEQVDLLLEALTEFHYSELTLKLNNSASNDLVATLSMLGQNPHVQQGRLFRLNINLESNISKIMDALAQAYGLSNTAIQRAFRLR